MIIIQWLGRKGICASYSNAQKRKGVTYTQRKRDGGGKVKNMEK